MYPAQHLTQDASKLVTTRPFLVVEDDSADAELVRVMLERSFRNEVDCHVVSRLSEAIECLKKGNYAAAILDLNLPDSQGIDNIRAITHLFPKLPLVVLTGMDDEIAAAQSLQMGAQDYLSKNEVTENSLGRSLRYAQERKSIELQLKQALEETARNNLQLKRLAQHDALTGLPNRHFFEATVRKSLDIAERRMQPLALLYFDLNNFKQVNDTLGHSAGDELLRKVAERAKGVVRDSDFIARMGGDEFVILTDLLTDRAESYSLVSRLNNTFSQPFHIAGKELYCEPSIGISFYPDAPSLDLLLKQADLAMYQAKSSNTSVCFFTKSMEQTYTRNLKISHHLTKAIENEEFICEFQPLFPVSDDNKIYAEALTRWQSPDLGRVTPTEFIPLLEPTPMHASLVQYLVSQCGELRTQAAQEGLEIGYLSINISVRDLSNANFCKQFLNWIQQAKLEPHNICLELCEREMIQNCVQCRANIERLRAMGIRIALDDFGTGFASVTHLVSLPLDILKLDKTLVNSVNTNSRNLAINAGIVEMAHRLNMKVVAEGIETQEEHEILKTINCDMYQGWYFSKSLELNDYIECMLLRHRAH